MANQPNKTSSKRALALAGRILAKGVAAKYSHEDVETLAASVVAQAAPRKK